MRNRSEDQITLVFIRHGKTKSNEEHRYLGQREEELSKEGEREILEYKRRKYYPAVDWLFTSPMKRCLQTAGLLYPDLEPVCIPEWKEMDFGAFEGKNYEELNGDEQYQKWIDSNGTLPFPEGESRESFILRCEKGFKRMLKEIVKAEEADNCRGMGGIEKDRSNKAAGKKTDKKTVGLIIHGGTIMALLSLYGDGGYFDYQTANGRGYLCTWTEVNGKHKLTNIGKI